MRLHGAPEERRDRIAVAVLSAATFLIYLALRALEQSGDSLNYAWSIRTGSGLFHPHHLGFSPVVRVIHLALAALGISSDPLFAAQLHNISWACAAVAGLFLAVRAFAKSFALAVALASLLAVCHGFWRFSTQAEVYVPATACLTLYTALALRPAAGRRRHARTLGLGLLLALAVLYHQTSVLFVVPLSLAAVAAGRWKGARDVLAAMVLAGVLVALAYVAAYAMDPSGPPTATGFVRFCLLYADHPNPGWGTLANVSLEGVGRSLKSQLANVVPLPVGRARPIVLLAGVFGAALVALAGAASRAARREPLPRTVLVLALAWLGTYYLFFLWWLPGESEFYVTTLVPLLLLLALVLSRTGTGAERRRGFPAGRAVAVGVVALFAGNLAWSVWPAHRSKGPAYATAADLAAMRPAACTVMSGYAELQNLRYYFGIERTTETLLPLLCAYTRPSIPDTYRVPAGECVVVPLAFLRPDCDQGGLSGLSRPVGWWRFTRWLFEVEDSSGTPVARSPRFAATCGGEPYVILSASKRRFRSWDEFFAGLDRLGGRGAPTDTVFRRWQDANRRLLANGGR